jgi:hypothetical protein
MSGNLAASVRARLLNLAKAEGSDFNGVLVRYALERLLYRISMSAHADRFLLKGAMLFALWYDMSHRSTRDADLLGFGPSDLDSIQQTFFDIASVEVEDGITFDPNSVSVQEIRKEAGYAGARVLITGELAGARCKTQVDIGFGDAVTPGPVLAVYPVLLADFAAPTLQTYPVYTVIAEKLHAIGLSDEFADDASRQTLWRAFLRKNQLPAKPLPELVAILRASLQPALLQAALLA